MLLHLARPDRTPVLVGQLVASVIVAVGSAAISGATVLAEGHFVQYRKTMVVVPLTAVFATATATIVRRPTWFFLGFGAWSMSVEVWHPALSSLCLAADHNAEDPRPRVKGAVTTV
ncbi:hypothetical protein AB0J90_26510 [Micromonospora sp. NPDC049523]|uniref:hypothetical protein n=1 Tax=Micromonospora sp. NPDC049523 TaxID=3155921 RepID=UPI00341C0530